MDQKGLLSCYIINADLAALDKACSTLCPYNYTNPPLYAQSSINQTIYSGYLYILDNTNLPCLNGTYFEEIRPKISIIS